MAIIDDYAGIAAQVRRLRGDRQPHGQSEDEPRRVSPYVSLRGSLRIRIEAGRAQIRRSPVLAKRGWSTD